MQIYLNTYKTVFRSMTNYDRGYCKSTSCRVGRNYYFINESLIKNNAYNGDYLNYSIIIN